RVTGVAQYNVRLVSHDRGPRVSGRSVRYAPTNVSKGGSEMSYLKRLSKGRAPQSAPIPGSGQVPNSADGFAWAVDDWARLRRFLIPRPPGGGCYPGEWELA